ncbi:hypothetical protein EDB81DRAFT_884706 [Dactylonectria macrodidyma]|uniref:Major facilitator superfamily (MFS) profile domain-containing protein n=1 Tax=Dactylonectria macrodidyma TaxID=307937 RepID=A0A9P9ER58_9HYPO|nr:hypothetical protein EDB81DRAFT_884706 [Dactylonectria macrodidyma]
MTEGFTNIVLICSAALSSFNYGYSINVIAGTLVQVAFNQKFLSGSNANMLIDSNVSGFFGAALIGCVVQAYISNRWGRKSVNRVAAVLVAIDNTLQAGAPHIAMFLVGRYITGLGCGMIITTTPVYLSEISPAHSRGLLVGLQGNFIVFGYISSSCAALGFHFVSKTYQWRLNYINAAFVGVCLLFSLLFLPESPRWLVEVNRPDEAGEILHNIHKTRQDPNGRVARAELSQIVAQVDQDRSQPRSWAFIFRTPSMRKRLVCTLLVWSMAQSTGITVLANLTPRLFGALCYDTILQLALALVWTVLAGGWGMAILVAIQAALRSQYLDSSNLAGVRAAVAIYFLIAFYFCCTLECVGYVYGCEIWPTHLRTHAFGSIGWKYYIVFICVTVALTIPCMFMLPETAGMSLEEIAVKFGDQVALDFEQAMDAKGGSTHIETTN